MGSNHAVTSEGTSFQLNRLNDLIEAKYRYDAALARALDMGGSDILLDSSSTLVEVATTLDVPVRRAKGPGDVPYLYADCRGVRFTVVGADDREVA